MTVLVVLMGLLVVGPVIRTPDVTISVLSSYRWDGRHHLGIRVTNDQHQHLWVNSDSVVVVSPADSASMALPRLGSWTGRLREQSIVFECEIVEPGSVRFAVPLRKRDGLGERSWLSWSEVVTLPESIDLLTLEVAAALTAEEHPDVSRLDWDSELVFSAQHGCRVWVLRDEARTRSVTVDALTGEVTTLMPIPMVD